jgi:uncharacterized protein
MKISIHEITDLETELDFTQEEEWVAAAVKRVDEQLDDADLPQIPRPNPELKASKDALRPIQVHFSIRKVDEVIVLNGNANTHVRLLCSRCANPFQFKTKVDFAGLFCTDPVMAGIAHMPESGEKPVGQNKGFARHAHDEASDDENVLDITYLSQDCIDLADVLTEQLQLQVPFQPLCTESCKGICPKCGTDLNVGRCACAKIAKLTPFSVLRDLKL